MVVFQPRNAPLEPNVLVEHFNRATLLIEDSNLLVAVLGPNDDVEFRRYHCQQRWHREVHLTDGDAFDVVIGRLPAKKEEENNSGDEQADSPSVP